VADEKLQQWLDSAVREGRLESRGSFQLDAAAAARKFGEYALQDPLAVVARLIRVACLCRSPVSVTLSRTDSTVEFSGFELGLHPLNHVFDSLFSESPAEREFAIAANTVAVRDAKELTITHFEASKVAVLELQADRRVHIREAYNLAHTETLTTVRWQERKPRSVRRDEAKLREWFRYCPVPLFINGTRLEIPFGRPRGPGALRQLGASKQVLLQAAWYRPSSWYWADHHALEFRLYHASPERNEVGLQGRSVASGELWSGSVASRVAAGREPCFLALGFGCDVEAQGRIDWVYRGQLVESAAEPGFSLGGVHAVVSCAGLPFDLTGEKPIQRAPFHARQQLIRDWVNCVHDYLDQRYPKQGKNVVHKVLFDKKWRADAPPLPRSERVQELLQRMKPA
jgi:hypothetical protein